MRLSFVLPLTALALAACNNSDTIVAKDESAESVAAKVAKSNIKPLPGRWESTMKIEKMEMAGMPPEAKAMMDKQMASAQTFTTCLTPEQAAHPDAGFFQGNESGCKYDKFMMAGGKLDAVMTCDMNGRKQKMTMSGTYGEEAYTINMSSTGEAQPGMPMNMVMSVASRRVGDCDGKETL
jgi:hypothetical protein